MTPTYSARAQDPTSWRVWWEHNKDPYLQLKRAIHDGGTTTEGAAFSVGQPVIAAPVRSLAPTPEDLEQEVLPILMSMLEEHDESAIQRELLLALGRAGTPGGKLVAREDLTAIAAERLSDGNHAVLEAAVIAMGLSGDFRAVETLSHVLHGCPDGCKSIGRSSVPRRVRALAAYGLGLAGARTEVSDVRKFIVRHLALTLDSEREWQRELRVACITALGLTPLPPAGTSYKDVKKSSDHGGDSLETQVAYLLWYFREDGFDDITRAHVPTAVARLAGGLSGEWKERMVEIFRKGLSKSSGEPRQVRQSCALALGLIADADNEDADVRARKALIKGVGDADLSTRYFSLMALAQAGGRPGNPDADGGATAGTPGVRKYLLHQLVRGKSGSRPWVGLALGVLGRSLLDGGQPLSSAVSDALESTLRGSRSPDDAGAYAIALGLRRDGQARGLIEKKLELLSGDELACGELAVALGLLDAGAASEGLWEIARDSKRRPHVLAQSAIALALLGDKSISRELARWLDEAGSHSLQVAIADALGYTGDRRALEGALAMLESDEPGQLARASAVRAVGRIADRDPLPWASRLSVGVNYRAETETLTPPGGGGLVSWD